MSDILDDLPGGQPAPPKREPTRIVGIDERGNRVGEDHPRAKLSDHEVELIRELHEGGMSCAEIARKFEVAKSTVSLIVNFKRRATAPMGFRRVRMTDGAARIIGGHVKPTTR